MKRLLRRLFGKRYAKGGDIPYAVFYERDKALKLHGAEGVFAQDGRLIYWKDITDD